jgi:hypothetical protein
MDLSRYALEAEFPQLTSLTERVGELERRASEQQGEVARLQRQLQQATENDLNAEAAAAVAGTKKPKPERPAIQQALEGAEHDAEVFRRALHMAQTERAHFVADNRDELREAILDSLEGVAVELRERALACLDLFAMLEDSRTDLKAVAPLPPPEEPLPEGWTGTPTTNLYLNFGPNTGPPPGPERGEVESVLAFLASLTQQFEERRASQAEGAA